MENKKNTNNIAHKNMLTIIAAVFLVINSLSLNAMDLKEIFSNQSRNDYKGWTCLHKAIHINDINEIKKLIKLNENINTTITYGLFKSFTPLALAAHLDNIDAVKLLLENNPDIEAKDLFGKTALSIAIDENHTDIAKLLLKNNANIDSKDLYGWTALHNSAYHDNKETTDLLLENNADFNATITYGLYKDNTALDLAIRFNSEEAKNSLTERKRSRDKFEKNNKNNVDNYPETKKEKLDLLNQ